MLYYLPLEGYIERYTSQWSAPQTGWLERNWSRIGLRYFRIDPGHVPQPIKHGAVVDAVGRSSFCFRQIEILLKMMSDGFITNSDTIYLDDFWTPGLPALFYGMDVMNVRPKVFAFLHAQSVDEFDFTYKMRHWLRPVEAGIGNALTGIFVCCPLLKELVVRGGIAHDYKVHVTGHPFSSQEVMERMPEWYRRGESRGGPLNKWNRLNQVVWSSRFDREKNPHFFLKVAERLILEDNRATVVVCTSAPELRSNDPTAVPALKELAAQYPGRIVLKEGLSKEAYYEILAASKVQFNCASQDFVAITLLEASVAGCVPVYPYFRSFPETFQYDRGHRFMYNHLDPTSAVDVIKDALVRTDLWTPKEIDRRKWIHERYDTSWIRMLEHMEESSKVPFNELIESQTPMYVSP